MTQLTFKIQKDTQIVLSYLTDIQKFVSVHPLIYKMTELDKNKYKVYESIKLGILTYRFTYQAVLTHEGSLVLIKASVMGLTKLTMNFHLREEGNETVVVEELTIKSVLPIKNFMTNLISKQHEEMFRNIFKA